MSNNQLSTIGWVKSRSKIQTAYKEYLKDSAGSEKLFFETILSFAKGKITTKLFDSPEAFSTVDDEAQEVAIYVWSKLKDFKGEPDAFYAWLNRICYAQGCSAFNSTKDSFDSRVELLVEEEKGTGVFTDNPEIYGGSVSFRHNGKSVSQAPRPQHQRELPEFIQGTDLKICMYIRAGKSYSQIADVLEITEKAVERRIFKMRNKIEEMKNA